jgi:hypothetical protein
MKESTKEAIDTMINGNLSDFREWLKKAKKIDILDAIEYHQQYGKRHEIINRMRNYLEEV